MSRSAWKYDTSEEDSGSVGPVTLGAGWLYFTNMDSGQECSVHYSYGSFGAAKGALLNIAKSVKATPSGAFTHVYSTPWHTFDPARDFPCGGYIFQIGATAGIFAPSFFDDSGGSVDLAVFGFIPFSTMLFWGYFDSILPSGGVAAAACKFGEPVFY